MNRQNQQISMVQEEHEAEKEEFVAVRKSDLDRIMALLSRLEKITTPEVHRRVNDYKICTKVQWSQREAL